MDLDELTPRQLDIQAQGAAFYIAVLKAGLFEEAADFAEWFLETFDIDLET